MTPLTKTCGTCGAWQPDDKQSGECRKNAPVIGGWPKVTAADWCLQWVTDERPKRLIPQSQKLWQIGINYAFVRDYPELATTWLKSVLANPDDIPIVLRPVLEDVFGAVWTPLLPDWLEGADCCEGILCWAEQHTGFCNDDPALEDAEYAGVLMSMANAAEIAASQQALGEIPLDHPWRATP